MIKTIKLFMMIGIVGIFMLFQNITHANFQKEFGASVIYKENYIPGGNNAGELYTSLKDGSNNYILTKGSISVSGNSFSCVENFEKVIINGNLNYVLGTNIASCDLDELVDGLTYDITFTIDTNNNGSLNGANDFSDVISYKHETFYNKAETDTLFVQNDDILDGSGTILKDVLPYKKGQLIGSGSNLLECSGVECDNSYFDVSELTPSRVIKGTNFGVGKQSDGLYDITNLTPENVRKGISFGVNFLGELEMETGTGITQVLAGGLCSGNGITCYMMDYNNDGFDDIIKKSTSVGGRQILDFYTFFQKGQKYILDKTLDLEGTGFSSVFSSLNINLKDITFYKGSEFFDDNKFVYLVINQYYEYRDTSGSATWRTDSYYKIIKIDFSNNGSLINLKTLLNEVGGTKTYCGSSCSNSPNNFQMLNLKKDNNLQVVLASYSWSQRRNGATNNPYGDQIVQKYLLYKGDSQPFVLLNNSTFRSFNGGMGNVGVCEKQFYILGYNGINNYSGDEGMPCGSLFFEIPNGHKIKEDYPNHIFIQNGNNLIAKSIIDNTETILLSNSNIRGVRSDNIVCTTQGSNCVNYYSSQLDIKNGNYFLKKDFFQRRENNSDEVRDLVLHKFFYNTSTKLIEYQNSILTRSMYYNGYGNYNPYRYNSSGPSSFMYYLNNKYTGNSLEDGGYQYTFNFLNGSIITNSPILYTSVSSSANIGGSSSFYNLNEIDLPNGSSLFGGHSKFGGSNSRHRYTFNYYKFNKTPSLYYSGIINTLSHEYESDGGYNRDRGYSYKIVGNLGFIKFDDETYISSQYHYRYSKKLYNFNTNNYIYNYTSPFTIHNGVQPIGNDLNGTGSILILGNQLYNSYKGTVEGGFTYDTTKGYLDTTFNEYRSGNFYLLPHSNGKTFLYEFDNVTQNLLLRSNDIVASKIGTGTFNIKDNFNNYGYILNSDTNWSTKNTFPISNSPTNDDPYVIVYDFNNNIYKKKIIIKNGDLSKIQDSESDSLVGPGLQPTFVDENNIFMKGVGMSYNPLAQMNLISKSYWSIGYEYYYSLPKRSYSGSYLAYNYYVNTSNWFSGHNNGPYQSLNGGQEGHTSDGNLFVYVWRGPYVSGSYQNFAYLHNKSLNTITQITNFNCGTPIISPDNNFVVCRNNTNGFLYKIDLNNINLNGEQITTVSAGGHSISNDGKYIFYTNYSDGNRGYVKKFNDNQNGMPITANQTSNVVSFKDSSMTSGTMNASYFFSESEYHLIGTSKFTVNGNTVDVGIIPQNDNEILLIYHNLKNNGGQNNVTLINDFRSIVGTHGNNILLELKNSTGGSISFQDINTGVSKYNYFTNTGSYLFANSGSVLFTNTAKNIANTNSPVFKYDKIVETSNIFDVYNNYSPINSSNFDFYVGDDVNKTVYLATKNRLFPAMSIHGYSTYQTLYGLDRQRAVTEYKKEKRMFFLNNDLSLVDTLNYLKTYSENSYGLFANMYNYHNSEKNLLTKKISDYTLARLNNIRFIPSTNNELSYDNISYFNTNFSTGSNFNLVLNNNRFISKNNYSSLFNNSTGSLTQSFDNSNLFNFNLSVFQHFGGITTCNVDDVRGVSTLDTNKYVKMNDGQTYIMNLVQFRTRNSGYACGGYPTGNYYTQDHYFYYYRIYLLENITTGEILLIPFNNTTLTENGEFVEFSTRLANINSPVSIKNRTDYLNIQNNSGLYFNFLNNLFIGRIDSGIYFHNGLLHKQYAGNGLNLHGLLNKNFVFNKSYPDINAYVNAEHSNNIFTGVVVNQSFDYLPNTNFVTDNLFITRRDTAGNPIYKVNGVQTLSLAQGGTVINSVFHLGGTLYKINQNGNDGTAYTNRDLVYSLSGNNLTYQYRLLNFVQRSDTFLGIPFTVSQSIYTDITNTTYIELKSSLFPESPQRKVLNKVVAGGNLFTLGGNGGSPYIFDYNNGEYFYNALQNVLISLEGTRIINSTLYSNTYYKVPADTIYTIKDNTNRLYVLDINGGFKFQDSTNGSRMAIFDFGESNTFGENRRYKLGDGNVGMGFTKYTGNLVNDITFYLNNPFYSNTSAITKTKVYDIPMIEYFTYTYNSVNYFGFVNLKNANNLYINHDNSLMFLSNVMLGTEDNKVYFYGYNPTEKKVGLYTHNSTTNIIELSDMQDAPTAPTMVNLQKTLTINGVLYHISDKGLLIMKNLNASYGTLPTN